MRRPPPVGTGPIGPWIRLGRWEVGFGRVELSTYEAIGDAVLETAMPPSLTRRSISEPIAPDGWAKARRLTDSGRTVYLVRYPSL